MEISNNILELIEAGYKQHCDSISTLVYERLNVSADQIFSRLFKEHRGVVNAYCDKHDIDLASVLEANNIEVKQDIGLSIIENDIMTALGSKSKYDDEIKQLGIKTIRITNGIEDCPWLTLFNSPNNLAWFVKRTDKVIEYLDPNNKWYDFIVQTIETIKDNWIDPQSVKPNLDDYWQLMDLEVPEEVKDLVVK
ncbi:hypothetical protein IQ255_24920 [Pleurocapsales cyanobacterium LEGE 10410]|nr:hypothetical protein [Pleurocapsales cyanobacterium LEGE 10410]